MHCGGMTLLLWLLAVYTMHRSCRPAHLVVPQARGPASAGPQQQHPTNLILHDPRTPGILSRLSLLILHRPSPGRAHLPASAPCHWARGLLEEGHAAHHALPITHWPDHGMELFHPKRTGHRARHTGGHTCRDHSSAACLSAQPSTWLPACLPSCLLAWPPISPRSCSACLRACRPRPAVSMAVGGGFSNAITYINAHR